MTSNASSAKTFQSLPPQQSAIISPVNYAFLQRYILAESGIVIEAGKQYLIEGRLSPILRENGVESLDHLSEQLAKQPCSHLGNLVIDAMTTNETLFFRDPLLFDALRTRVLPSMQDGVRGTRKIRIWSAAASSGQEAYSVAMTLLDLGWKPADFEILGTDISPRVISRAQAGRYTEFEVHRGLPTPLLTRYFNHNGLEWQLQEDVRRLVRFMHIDLRGDLRFLGKFDLILCRNVLIYFNSETKIKILDGLHELLTSGGVLVLGCAETILDFHAGLRRDTIGQSTFYSQNV